MAIYHSVMKYFSILSPVEYQLYLFLGALPDTAVGRWDIVSLEWNQETHSPNFFLLFHGGHFQIFSLPFWGLVTFSFCVCDLFLFCVCVYDLFFTLSILGPLGLGHCRRIGTFL